MGGRARDEARERKPVVDRCVVRAFDAAWDHLVVEDPVRSTDAIFCFGSRHWRVPERAASLFAHGVAPLVVVTGGSGADGDTSEAERFAADLVTAGVPEDRLILEHRARHTGENVVLGLQCLRQHIEPRQLTLVSWPLAARRCRATFAHFAPGIDVASAPALREPGVPWQPTLRRIRFSLGELDRLERYARDGLIQRQVRPPAVGQAAMVLRSALDAAHAGPASDRSAHDAPRPTIEAPWPLREPEARPLVV